MSDATLDSALSASHEAGMGEYWALLKPRVMSLVVFTALVGLVAAPGSVHPFIAFVAVLCIAVGGGAAGALNMWWESDIDALMRRTRGRPIPSIRDPRPVVVGLFWRTLVLAPDVGLVDMVTRALGLGSHNWLGDPQLALMIRTFTPAFLRLIT